MIDVEPHVLRFWESRFTFLDPMKRGGGRRYYSVDDIEILKALKHYLHEQGMPIRAVNRMYRAKGAKAFLDWQTASSASPEIEQQIHKAEAKVSTVEYLTIVDQLISNAKTDIHSLKLMLSRLDALA